MNYKFARKTVEEFNRWCTTEIIFTARSFLDVTKHTSNTERVRSVEGTLYVQMETKIVQEIYVIV